MDILQISEAFILNLTLLSVYSQSARNGAWCILDVYFTSADHHDTDVVAELHLFFKPTAVEVMMDFMREDQEWKTCYAAAEMLF